MRHILVILVTTLFFSCKQDQPDKPAVVPQEVVIGMTKSPDRINPIIYPTSLAREVYQYIFLPLADYNPETYDLEPILIESLPESTILEEGPYAGKASFKMRIIDDAIWENGSPITGKDYAFTIKAIKHPLVKASAYRNYYTSVADVLVNEEDPKEFQVIIDKPYMLDREVISSLPLYPAYFYDPEGALAQIEVAQLNDPAIKERDHPAKEKAFAEAFNSLTYSRERISGAGPYRVVDWSNDETIILEAKPDYFGNALSAASAQTGAERLIFKIIADETALITQLKAGNIDLVSSIDANTFKDLKENPTYIDAFNFATPPVFQYYFIGLNNKDPRLLDSKVRRALAHITDVNYLIRTFENGNAQRTIGIVNPAKKYYNKNLEPIPYDIEKAKTLLTEAGWVDNNKNGTLEKTIEGKETELVLDFYITGSEVSKGIALNFQEEAKKVGITVNIISTTLTKLRSDHLNTGKYQLAALAVAQDIGYNDPYNKWHSDNATPEGNNEYGYTSGVSDGLINNIRKSKDIAERNQYYMKLQEVMYNDQPAIFLYTPSERIVYNKAWTGIITAKRPGYLANTFTYSQAPEAAER